HLARGRLLGDLLGQRNQLVGGVAAGADDDDDLAAGLAGADGPPRRRHDALGRGDAAAAELLDNERQGPLLLRRGCGYNGGWKNVDRNDSPPEPEQPEAEGSSRCRLPLSTAASRGAGSPSTTSCTTSKEAGRRRRSSRSFPCLRRSFRQPSSTSR